ncbi:ABC transporter permease [bacterium]|nr:ABC transporter permease [bacterium]
MYNWFRVLKFGWLNFWRNWVLSSASIIVLAIALLIISTFVAFNFLLQKTVEGVNQKVDVIVYFKDSAKEETIEEIKNELSVWDEVKSVNYITKKEALEKWLSTVEDERLKDIVSERNNPLPRSLEIKLVLPEYASRVVEYFSQEEVKSDVSKVRYNRLVVDKIITYSKAVKKVGISLSIVFALVAVYVVLNTLRLAVYARRNEIEIMKLVGASPNYIVMPFIVEGIMFGVLGAVLAFALTLLGAKYALSVLFPKEILNEISSFLQFSSFGLTRVFALQIGLGVLVGVVCSLVGVKKYLR